VGRASSAGSAQCPTAPCGTVSPRHLSFDSNGWLSGRPVRSPWELSALLRLRNVGPPVAVDAPSSSYLMNIGGAVISDSGITLEDAQDILVAVAPIVGSARVLSATTNMGKALGFALGEVAEAAMDADEG
jgi:hypothetical protein